MRRLLFVFLLACAAPQVPPQPASLDPAAARHIADFEWRGAKDAVVMCGSRYDCEIRIEHCRDILAQQERLLSPWTAERERWFRYLVTRMADQIEYLDPTSQVLPLLRQWGR